MKIEYIIGIIILLALGGGGLLYQRSVHTMQAEGPTSPEVISEATSTPEASATSTTSSSSGKSAAKDSGPTIAPPSTATALKKAALYQKAPELKDIAGYINTGGSPIKISDFRGKKVVLIDIWTYSCINCQRTLPYIKDWWSKYADKGLEIIGVHTPEFSFEKVLANVQKYVTDNGIKYPVVLDNSYGTWNAFGNQYWPRKYLIDVDGYIVYDHAGEGNYAETEAAIQKALAERDSRLGVTNDSGMPMSDVSGTVSDADLRKIQSPETYFGSERNDRLGNGLLWSEGDQTMTIPATLKINSLYLSGTWNFQPEYATNKTAGAQIRYQYDSKSVYFVAAAGTPVKIKVTRDGGKPLGSARGADVDSNGEATISGNRLYKLIEDTGYATHTLEIQIEGTGLKAYTFTFG